MHPTTPLPDPAHDILRHVRGNPLDALFSPRSVALVGASHKTGGVGTALVKGLEAFQGPLYWVSATHLELGGKRCYPRVTSLPAPVDLVVIATPAPTVPGIIRDCVAHGVQSAIIISAGFRETGADGMALEREIHQVARQGNLRVIGPNCLGVMIPHRQLNATFADGMAEPGSVAFLSQSGALCSAVLDWSRREHVGFSAFVSVGSMLDVDWGDLLTFFGDDPQTKSILCYMESVGDARRFLSAAREVALTKPVIILKVGRTQEASKAAASHTGSLTGSDAVFDAAMQRAGVLRVDTIEELFGMAETLSKQPLPKGPRLGIVTNAGGAGALATDLLILQGAKLAPLEPTTLSGLNALLPKHWSHGNPVDVLGDADAARYRSATELVVADPNTDGVLVILTPQAMTQSRETAEAISQIPQSHGKPVLASWMGAEAVDSGRVALNESGIPTFDYPDLAAKAFSQMWHYRDRLQLLYQTPGLTEPDSASPEDRSAADELLRTILDADRTLLSEHESKQLLKLWGIPVVPSLLATTEQEAVTCAESMGGSVVLKLHSLTLTHKTDVGGVKLNLVGAEAVRRAWHEIRVSVSSKAGPAHFQGVSVQPMIEMTGHELILGSSTDLQFGPVLLFGSGGRLVEVYRDTVLGLPPLNAVLARRMMESIALFPALNGARGQKPIALEALTNLLVRFSERVINTPRIAEIELNPILASSGSDQLIALDARIVLHPRSISDSELPRPAIRPYPRQYCRDIQLKDGAPAKLRPIQPEDEPLMIEFHHTLSDRSVYMRYFSPLRLDERIAHKRLSRLCFIDYDREIALVVEATHRERGRSQILGVGRLSKAHSGNSAEFALTVSDSAQGQGVGTELLKALVQVGHAEGIKRISARILADNRQMQHVARKAGFTLRQEPGSLESIAELTL